MRNLLLLSAIFIIGLFGILFTYKLSTVEHERLKASKYAHKNLPYKFRDKKSPKSQATPDGFWAQDFEATKDPETGQYHTERLVAAWNKMKQEFSGISSRRGNEGVSLTNTTWNERGPANVSGRTRAIMLDPNDPSKRTVFAGGVNGGIWKTTNIQNDRPNWVKIDDFMDVLSISWLTYDPTNTQVFYATTGEGYGNNDAARGAGLFKSTNGGQSWFQLASTANFEFCQRVLVTKTGTVILATNQGLYRSTNGGSTFTFVLGSGSATDPNRAYDIDESSDSVLLATLNGSIHRSTNDGATWSGALLLPTDFLANRIELAFAPSDPNYVYGIAALGSVVNGILRSTNKGSTWELRNEPEGLGMPPGDISRGQAWYDLCIDVSPADKEMFYVGGIDLYRTSDGGLNWTMVSQWFGGFGLQEVHADQHIIYYEPGNGNVCYFGNDGGIYRTTNAAAAEMPTISSRKDNYNITQFYACALHPGKDVEYMLAGAQDNGSQRFSRVGMNNTFEVTGGDGAFCHISQTNPMNQWTSYIFNSYYRSTNGGVTFVSSDLPDNTGASFINPSDYDNRGNIMYLSDNPGTFFRWIDPTRTGFQHKVSCAAFGGGRVTSVYVSDSIAHRVYFGLSNGRIVRVQNVNNASILSTNGTWLNQFAGMPSGSISCITEDPKDPNHLMATYSNFNVNSVWESKNGGSTWTSVEGNLSGANGYDIPFRNVLISPVESHKALVATELGVWATDSLRGSNTTWFPANNGLANTRVTMLQRRASDNFVIASTHGRGLYSTEVFMVPFAAFTGPQAHYLNSTYQLENRSRNSVSTRWTVDNQFSYTATNPTHTFSTIGSYDIGLSINNNFDSILTENYVKILPDLPTSYTPQDGGDFENNEFHFGSESLSGSRFELASSNVSGKNGTFKGSRAYVLAPNDNLYQNNTVARVYSPTYDFSEDAFYSFSFYTKFDIDFGLDGLYVEYSTDKGQTWEILGTKQPNWYNHTNTFEGRMFPVGSNYFTGKSSNQFEKKFIDVSFLKSNPHVAFRFTFLSDAALTKAGVAIDYVWVHKSKDGVEFPDPTSGELTLESVFPTAFNNNLTIRYSTKDEAPISLLLYTVKGQLVYSDVLASATKQIGERILSFPDLSEGMYVIQLREGDKSVTQKVIKKR